MKVSNQIPQKKIIQPILLSLVAASAIAIISEVNLGWNQSAIAKQVISLNTPKPIPPDATNHRSRWGFTFGYSLNSFVVQEKISNSKNKVNSLLGTIDIWTKKHAQQIRAGAYAGGAEYPANIQISVYSNKSKLPLQNWIKKNNRFVEIREVQTTKIAGQNGIKFKSSGLYDNEHIVFFSPKNSRIIVVSLSKFGSGSDDAAYQAAYNLIVDSLKFTN